MVACAGMRGFPGRGHFNVKPRTDPKVAGMVGKCHVFNPNFVMRNSDILESHFKKFK